MTVTIGRLRTCPVLGYKFIALGHNTVRGAAGAAVLNAELLVAEGVLCCARRGTPMRVLKFGGTSVADQDAIARLAAIVRREAAADATAGIRARQAASPSSCRRLPAPPIACSESPTARSRASPSPALDSWPQLRERHLAVARAVARPGEPCDELCAEIDEQFDRLGAVVRSLAVLREASPRSLDAVAAIGELLSSRIVAAALVQQDSPPNGVTRAA